MLRIVGGDYSLRAFGAGLSGGRATIDWQVDARDEAALVGCEEHRRRCKVIRRSKPSHGDHLAEIFARAFWRPFRSDMNHGRLGWPRTDHVCPDATAGQLRGPATDKGNQRCFRS